MIENLLALSDDERIPVHEPSLPPELQAGLGRIFNFTRLLRDLLERSAPEEVSLNGLSSINSYLQQAYSDVSAFISSGNQANLTNAVSNIDNATNAFAWAFYSRPVRGAKPQFESVETVRRAAENAIASITDRTAEFQNSVDATAGQLQSQDERITQLSTTLDEVRSSAAAAVASIQQQFSENLSTYRSEFDELKSKFRSTQQEFSADAAQKAKDLIKELEGQRDQAAKIVQVVGNIGVTGNYLKRASDEQTQANVWRAITLTLFGTGVVLVTVNLILNFTGHVDLPTLIARFAIAVTVAIPALYTARESARHRTNADRAKQTELELASLSPFLEALDATKRKEIIAGLATSYFGQHIETHDVKAPVSLEEIQKTIASASEFVAKVKGG